MKAMPTNGQNPHASNRAARTNRFLRDSARRDFTIVSSRGRIPRKRKKYILGVERANYIGLIRAVAEGIMADRAATARRDT